MKIERQIKRILNRILYKVDVSLKRKFAEVDLESSREIDEIDQRIKEIPKKRQHLPDATNLSDYYFENGLRKVYPYWYTYTAVAKQRWIGKSIHELYSTEFRRCTIDGSLSDRFESGRIKVNGKIVTGDYYIREHDVITHLVHRHERFVLDRPLKIQNETRDFIVLNKPSSIPVHPCGRYFLNTITGILAKEHRLSSVKLVHRLDRETSGLLLLAKSKSAANWAEHLISSRCVVKRYICMIDGILDKEIEVNQPIKVLSYKHGICRIERESGENGSKSAKTLFRPYTSMSSNIVECLPETGRMHQIRVHLQSIGLPVIGDDLYSNKHMWGDKNGLNGDYCGRTDDDIIAKFNELHSYEKYVLKENSASKSSLGDDRFDNDCFECTHSFTEPEKSKMEIKLHALSYTFNDPATNKKTVFTCPLPDWAITNCGHSD
ncbi:hypothetical protein GJ496_003143 [Pomphorhynchus laevis]|nr:hypothetical protein GJ496_003143 [Pomphorhynchus laevis]